MWFFKRKKKHEHKWFTVGSGNVVNEDGIPCGRWYDQECKTCGYRTYRQVT